MGAAVQAELNALDVDHKSILMRAAVKARASEELTLEPCSETLDEFKFCKH